MSMEVPVTRKMLTSVVLAAVSVLVTAMPAAAQSQDQNTTTPVPQFQINASFLPDVTAPSIDTTTTFDDQAAPKTHTMGDRQVFIRLDGGLVFCCSNTGFVVGVTVSGQPRSLKNIEIEGNVGFGRLAGFNFLTFGADGLYDFHMTGHEAMPFAGAGLGITHIGSVTNTAFEILGGVQLPVNGPHVVRVEIKFLFTTATTTILLVNYSF
jgi:hypothetical protein